jgi:hypothetical protein
LPVTPRRIAGTAALVVAASGLALPLATPAGAVGASQTSFVVVDTGGDGLYGLYTMPTPSGTQTAVTGFADSPVRDVYDLTASPGGGRVAFVVDTYASPTSLTPGKEQLVVLDKSGQLVRVVRSISPSTAGVFSPALSPDGNTVVWSEVSAAGILLRSADVGTGATTTISTSVVDAVFADPSTLFGYSTTTGHHVWIPAAGGAATTIAIPDEATDVSVSPASSFVAWTLDRSTSAETTVADVQLATLDMSTKTIGAPTTMATGQNNHGPAWDVASFRLEYVHDDGVGGAGDILQVDAGNPANTTAVGPTPGLDEQEVDIVGVADATPPAAPTIDSTFTLKGTSATLRWTLPADTDGDLSGVLISRQGRTFYVPAPLPSVVDTGLTVGTQYDYTIKAVDRSGNLSATGATRSLRAIAPGAYFGDPTSTYSTEYFFPVRFALGDTNGAATYVVKYLPYGGTLKTWVDGAAGATRTFGVAGNGSTVADTTALAGGNYKFAVTVTDEFGNSSAATVSSGAVVPFDQSKAYINGGTDYTSLKAYNGFFHRMNLTTDVTRVTLVGDRLQVVGWRCSTCGSFALYDGAAKVATVSTYSASTVARTVLLTKTYTGNAKHVFTIRPLGTAGHPGVVLDAFAMRRT